MFSFHQWADNFLNQPTTPLNDKDSRFFMLLVMEEQKENSALTHADFAQDPFLQLVSKRAEHLGLHLSAPATLFLAHITRGNPGNAVMYLSTIRSRFSEVSMTNLAQLFPKGWPNEDALSKMWDEQKGFKHGEKVDNCLDFLTFEKPKTPKP